MDTCLWHVRALYALALQIPVIGTRKLKPWHDKATKQALCRHHGLPMLVWKNLSDLHKALTSATAHIWNKLECRLSPRTSCLTLVSGLTRWTQIPIAILQDLECSQKHGHYFMEQRERKSVMGCIIDRCPQNPKLVSKLIHPYFYPLLPSLHFYSLVSFMRRSITLVLLCIHNVWERKTVVFFSTMSIWELLHYLASISLLGVSF